MQKSAKKKLNVVIACVCLLAMVLSVVPAFSDEEYAQGTEELTLSEGKVDEVIDPEVQEGTEKASELGEVVFFLNAPESLLENVNSVDIYCVSNEDNDDFIVSVLKEEGFKKVVNLPKGTYKTMYCDALGLADGYTLRIKDTIMVGEDHNAVNIYMFDGDSCVNETSYDGITPANLVYVSDDYLNLVGKNSLYTEESATAEEIAETSERPAAPAVGRTVFIVVLCGMIALLLFFMLHMLIAQKKESAK